MTRVHSRQNPSIEVETGDITRMPVTAIVNAANEVLARGGGVCGAIFRAAGRGLAEECAAIGSCPVGEARLTRGYGLPAGWIIHCAGPVWRGGGQGEAALLASCFPAISTGIFGYPADEAARVAVAAVRAHAGAHDLPRRIILVAFDEAAAAPLRAALAQ